MLAVNPSLPGTSNQHFQTLLVRFSWGPRKIQTAEWRLIQTRAYFLGYIDKFATAECWIERSKQKQAQKLPSCSLYLGL